MFGSYSILLTPQVASWVDKPREMPSIELLDVAATECLWLGNPN